MSDPHFDAGAGSWLNADGSSFDERPEDEAAADPTEAEERQGLIPDSVAADPDDPEDDPAFRAAKRAHREMSGAIDEAGRPNHGRHRATNPTGLKGRGLRGLRVGTKDGDPAPVRKTIRPGGRQLGARAPMVGRPSYEDADTVVEKMLGDERIERLRASLVTRGASRTERVDRAYLAILLRLLDSTAANTAAAELLLDGSSATDLRKIGDLRRRAYPEAAEDSAWSELRLRLGR